jgi:tetratricopeptide (TPR) repeat protein
MEQKVEDKVAVTEFKQAIKVLREGYPDEALEYFRKAVERERNNPYYLSFLGVCVARVQRNWGEALKLCEAALHSKRNEPQFYLNLAEVYVCAGRRGEAIEILDGGLTYCGTDDRLRRARIKFGRRSSAILPFLERHHFLNKNLGRLRHSFFEFLTRIHRGGTIPSKLRSVTR